MKKAVALNSTVPVVRSEKLPAPRKPVKWRDFNRFAADVEELHKYVRDLRRYRSYPQSDDCGTSSDFEDEAEWLRQLVGRCEAGFEQFDRDDNYEEDEEDGRVLKQSHIAKRITVMVSSFANSNPGCPEGYLQMMIEHVSAIERLSEPALETACREIVETQKFAPAISEVMTTITDHVLSWNARRWSMRDAEKTWLELIEVLKKHEREKAKQEHESKIRQATYQARCAMDATQRLAKEIETAKAALAALMQRHAEAEKRASALMSKLGELENE
jgi:hypothetical protein